MIVNLYVSLDVTVLDDSMKTGEIKAGCKDLIDQIISRSEAIGEMPDGFYRRLRIYLQGVNVID